MGLRRFALRGQIKAGEVEATDRYAKATIRNYADQNDLYVSKMLRADYLLRRKLNWSGMKSIIIMVFGLILFNPDGFGQGAWDMEYLPLDSLNDSFIGRELRIDFKSGETIKTRPNGRNVRSFFAKCDTVTLKLSGQSLRFVETWKIYVDHGTLADQTLRSVDGNKGEQLIIIEMIVRAISKSFLTVEAYTYRTGDKARSGSQEINIDKTLIDGIIVRL